jgi:hypothetical protein
MLEVKVLDKLLKVLKNLQNKHFSLNKVLKMLSPQDFMPHICHTFTLLHNIFHLQNNISPIKYLVQVEKHPTQQDLSTEYQAHKNISARSAGIWSNIMLGPQY